MLGVLLCSGNGELSTTAKSNKRGIHCRDGESAAGSVVSRVVLLAAASIASLRYWFSASTRARRCASMWECLERRATLRSSSWTCCFATSRDRFAESLFFSMRSIFLASSSLLQHTAACMVGVGVITSGPFIAFGLGRFVFSGLTSEATAPLGRALEGGLWGRAGLRSVLLWGPAVGHGSDVWVSVRARGASRCSPISGSASFLQESLRFVVVWTRSHGTRGVSQLRTTDVSECGLLGFHFSALFNHVCANSSAAAS
jgi:hypothetical protein